MNIDRIIVKGLTSEVAIEPTEPWDIMIEDIDSDELAEFSLALVDTFTILWGEAPTVSFQSCGEEV